MALLEITIVGILVLSVVAEEVVHQCSTISRNSSRRWEEEEDRPCQEEVAHRLQCLLRLPGAVAV